MSCAVMKVSFDISESLGKGLLRLQGVQGGSSPISGIPVSILLGLSVNTLILKRFPSTAKLLAPGLAFSSKRVLQAGIVCIGAKLSAGDVMELGGFGVPAVTGCIATGLLFTTWFGRRMGLSTRLSALIASGTSICGVTAITAVAPVIGATSREVAISVANVVAFGLFGMLCYPYLAHELFGPDGSKQVGVFLGTAIHDTSQVMGAALTYDQVFHDEVALKTAAVTKLTRNLFLAAVVPYMGYHFSGKSGGSVLKYFPGFVIGFVGMAVLRSAGDYSVKEYGKSFGVMDFEVWQAVTKAVGSTASGSLLGIAMAGVGLSTDIAVLRGVGAAPFITGFAGASIVACTGLLSAILMGRYLSNETYPNPRTQTK